MKHIITLLFLSAAFASGQIVESARSDGKNVLGPDWKTNLGFLEAADVAAAYQPLITNGSLALNKLATSGTASSSTYLRGDGAWSTVSGGGSVGGIEDVPGLETALDGRVKKATNLYHDFSQHADNTVFALNASYADTGQVHKWSTHSNSGIAPLITGGALVGHPDKLFYYGHDLDEPIKSIGFEIEYQYTGGGISRAAPTFAFHSTPVIAETSAITPGDEITLPSGMLHVEMSDSGIQKFGFSETQGVNFQMLRPMGIVQNVDGSTPFSDNFAGGTLLGAGKHVITFAFAGADCIVTVLGRSWVFRHPPAKSYPTINALPTDGDTMVIGSSTYRWKNTLAAAGDVKIGGTTSACAANLAAAIDTGSGSGTLYGTGTVKNVLVRSDSVNSNVVSLECRLAGPVGNSTTISSSNLAAVTAPAFTGGERTPIAAMGPPKSYFYEAGRASTGQIGYAKLYRVWANSPAFDTFRHEPWTNRLGTDGQLTLTNPLTLTSASFTVNSPAIFNGTLKHQAYAGLGGKNVNSNLDVKSGPTILSTAGSNYTSGSMLNMAGRALVYGNTNTYHLTGYFADTADDRRIAIHEAYVGNFFDSGVLTGASVRGKRWSMKITVQGNSGLAKVFMTEFTVSGAPTVIQYGQATSAQAANISFRTTSQNAGDIEIITYYATSEN